ncbi:hypothetical protein JIN84_19340 [Luteolibacter yonseiensis]|uniref:DUF4350 domain-containing protein n=2 Tax=Luteolibacter yonseiensis TaxID=1144680 RepID=A0A934R8C8_9BACT|nr:DUF4350 domain-containing protein [Luteolibacter yonseiensis]MBK1817783.1 hypothetical protein [Luteolibacter yonseiensis]
MLLAVLVITGCDYTEVKREIGYKGKARINPWLAAERFCEQYDGEVRSLAVWTAPQYDDAIWFVPASVPSNTSYIRQLESWVEEGGHLVLLVEHADAESSDWSRHAMPPDLEPVLLEMLDRAGIELKPDAAGRGEVTAERIRFRKESYEVDAKSDAGVARKGGKQGVFASVRSGDGRITVLTDARIFRNRWIGDKDHAALLDALVAATEYEGNIGFLRGSGLSLWGLLKDHLWPVLVGLALLMALWLWRSFSRFGPIESADAGSPLRGYDHHLEALGDFQWRLDRAAALLVPLREQIIERGQRIRARAGRRDDDFIQFLAERAEIPRERVHRALVEAAPADSAILTRTTADLQRLLQVLH